MTDQPIFMGYGKTAGVDTVIGRRWFYTAMGYMDDYSRIDQMDTRQLFELAPKLSSGNEYSNGYVHRILPVAAGTAVTIFSTTKTHPFMVDNEYDYYPTGRLAHNYVRIENDPVNMMGSAPADKEEAMVEASQRIGAIRDGYLRKVEHIGGTPRTRLIEDLLQGGSQSVTKIPLFPPLPTTAATPDRIFLRTTDMGYKHYVRSNYSSSSPYEARETKEVTGKRTIIWDGDNVNFLRETNITAPEDANRIVDNEAVEVEDIEDLGNAALNAVSTALNNRFVADDKEWEVIHIPGRAAIRISSTEIILEHYKSDPNMIGDRTDPLAVIKMTKDGSIEVKNGADVSVTLTSSTLVLVGGGRTVTMASSVVNVT